MNDPTQLDTFETALLSELRREVAEHPATAPAPRRAPRRRLKVLAAGAVATAAATVVAVGLTGGGPTASPAFAVDANPDGSVEIVIHELADADGLEAALAEHGIDADVDFDADGIGTTNPDGTISYVFPASPEFVPPGEAGPDQGMDATCGPTDPDPATLEQEADDWVLSIPSGSPLLDRHVGISTAPEGGLLVWYGGNVPSTWCVVGS